jgi:hypothetical protein
VIGLVVGFLLAGAPTSRPARRDLCLRGAVIAAS